MRMANGAWENELQDLLETTFRNSACFISIGIGMGNATVADAKEHDTIAFKIFDFAMEVFTNRAWTLHQYITPPMSHSCVFSSTDASRLEASQDFAKPSDS